MCSTDLGEQWEDPGSKCAFSHRDTGFLFFQRRKPEKSLRWRFLMYVHAKSFHLVQFFAALLPAACQAPLSSFSNVQAPQNPGGKTVFNCRTLASSSEILIHRPGVGPRSCIFEKLPKWSQCRWSALPAWGSALESCLKVATQPIHRAHLWYYRVRRFWDRHIPANLYVT